MLQDVPEPGIPYAASVPGFRDKFLRITLGGFFGRPAYSAAWAAKPGQHGCFA
jgi:hypothetical protein